MGAVIVMNSVTLDNVMQSPGRPDEDTRDGFDRGGWATSHSDEVMTAKMGERMGQAFAFLFGRRTYDDLLSYWNTQGGPFKESLNNARKYVASNDPATRLDWPNSTLLHGDVPAAVSDIKQNSGTNLVIMGSGVLIGSLSWPDRRVPADDPSHGARDRTEPLCRRNGSVAAAGRQHHRNYGRVDRHVRTSSRLGARTVAYGLVETSALDPST
jgi:dihydrofolate reductase